MTSETCISGSIDDYSLLSLATTYSMAGEHHQALACYNALIKQEKPTAEYYSYRASTYSDLYKFDKSSVDMDHAIEIDPDNAGHYWLRGGYLLSNELTSHGQINEHSNKKVINQILSDYALSLEKDPARSAAWLNLIEINVILRRWDDAIATYGACHSYIDTREFSVIREFLGCLALTLAGDELSDDDQQLLNDTSITVSKYRFSEIDALLRDLDNERYDNKLLEKAFYIRNRFVDHFTDIPNNKY